MLWLHLSVIADMPPANHARDATVYDWCDCGTGRSSVLVWPSGGDRTAAVRVLSNGTKFVSFKSAVRRVHWLCDGMASPQSSARIDRASNVWSLRVLGASKPECTTTSGRLHWNTWSKTAYRTSVPFTSGADDGFACVKIPTLLRTHAGTLVAMAEARTPDCSDFARTVLVFKRSADGGATWSPLGRLPDGGANRTGVCGAPPVTGNAAPVQLPITSRFNPGRILVPHVRDNFAVWLTHSDDDGVTWSPARELANAALTDAAPECNRSMAYFGVYDNATALAELVADLGWGTFDPYVRWRAKLSGPWQFVGLGPPGGIVLRSSGRVVIPGYHSFIRGLSGGSGGGAGVGLPISQLYNNFALGHALLSDDGGATWRLRSMFGFGDGEGRGANEAQLVELSNGSVLVNSRSLSTGSLQQRVQARSDDFGESFGRSAFVGSQLPEPFNGCQGSLVGGAADPTGRGALYFSHPNGAVNHGAAPALLRLLGASVNLTGRDHMTVWSSSDGGGAWAPLQLVDPGAAGYSSLQLDRNDSETLWILYEQSDAAPLDLAHLAADAVLGHLSVLDPDRIVLRALTLAPARGAGV